MKKSIITLVLVLQIILQVSSFNNINKTESNKTNNYNTNLFKVNKYKSVDLEYEKNQRYSVKEDINIPSKTVVAPKGFGFTKYGDLVPYADSNYESNIYTEPGGYVTLTTDVKQIGFYDNNILYEVVSTAKTNKTFINNKKDSLIIRTGENSTVFSDGNIYGKSLTYVDKNILKYTEDLVPDFTKGPGVVYDFKLNTKRIERCCGTSFVTYGSNYVKATYCMVVTDTTSIQTIYVHNQQMGIESLSFNYGYVGTSINLNNNSAAIYQAKPITLPGYKGSIKKVSYSIKPTDYNFESDYNYDVRTKNHNIHNLAFSTKRLRCGFIESQYLTLSSKKKNVDQSFLEYDFNTPIYEFRIELSLWSNKEQFTSDDKAYLQYKNKNDEWVSLANVLDNNFNLPTITTKPTTYKFTVPSGTKNIRLLINSKPNLQDRNKGRLCVGTIYLTTYIITD